MARSAPTGRLVAGIDLATADARVTIAGDDGRLVARSSARIAPPHRPAPGTSEQDARTWWPAVAASLRQALVGVAGEVVAVAVSATSGTVVVADRSGEPLGPAVLYDDSRVPPPARWDLLLPRAGAVHAWHAADLIVAHLTGGAPPTDWSHALKTGFDPATGRWRHAGPAGARRPEVLAPTAWAGAVSAAAASETGLTAGASVRLGMTDACAAQLAAGADRPGRFVSVLGTTLAVKGASQERIDDPASGVYSHRHPEGWWLPGGASNTGGGSLVARFGSGDPATLDRQAVAYGPAGTQCYPLTGAGERFPFATAAAEEIWTAPPADPVEAYRAVLEGVAFVERLGYERLGELGAPLTGALRSAGAGSRSDAWTAIRATVLGLPILRPERADTAFGACVIAAAGTLHPTLSEAVGAMAGAAGPEVAPVAGEGDRLEESYQRFVAALVGRGWLPWRR